MTSRSLLFGFGILIAAQAAQAQPVPQSPPKAGPLEALDGAPVVDIKPVLSLNSQARSEARR
jgi:tRNA (Thr-GGU) A37 N-methylase